MPGPEGEGCLSRGRLVAYRRPRLEEVCLQGGAGLPVKGGQNSREGTWPGFRRLPGLKQLRCARAGAATSTARHPCPQRSLERLGPGPGAQRGGQRAGAQTRAGQAGCRRRRQRRGGGLRAGGVRSSGGARGRREARAPRRPLPSPRRPPGPLQPGPWSTGAKAGAPP